MIKHLKKGFTLIELIIVIAIIGILTALLMPNFMTARVRARDAAKKADLRNLKTALQLYMGDYQAYPAAAGAGTDIAGCGTDGDEACRARTGGAFEAGGATYMKKFPASFSYYVNAARNDFVLRVSLENVSDEDVEASQSRCATSCTATGATCSGADNFFLCPD